MHLVLPQKYLFGQNQLGSDFAYLVFTVAIDLLVSPLAHVSKTTVGVGGNKAWVGTLRLEGGEGEVGHVKGVTGGNGAGELLTNLHNL